MRRARRGDALPPINALVALYNALSLRFLVPVGGDDLDLVSGGLHLRAAKGDEPFKPLGAEEEEPPEAGEIVYADDAKVLCRRWSWRGGEPSKISAATTNAVLNVHGLAPATLDEVTRATETLATLVRQVCGGARPGTCWTRTARSCRPRSPSDNSSEHNEAEGRSTRPSLRGSCQGRRVTPEPGIACATTVAVSLPCGSASQLPISAEERDERGGEDDGVHVRGPPDDGVRTRRGGW